MSIEFKIGADPELFILDTETGKHVSAFGMIPGTKHDPLKVEGGAVQVDGMALEFNIDPATTFKEFNTNINKVLGQLRAMVPERYKFDFSPVAHFGNEYIDEQPDEAKALGCDPDFDAWEDGAINPKPNGNLGIRTASGHIHIGWTDGQDVTDPDHIQAGIMLTKQLDYYLGVPSLIWDGNSQRRSMYGNPGAFRPKRYGVEYRTLSNVWVDNIDLRRFVFDQSMMAAEQLIKGNRVYEHHTGKHAHYLFKYATWGEIREHVINYLPYRDGKDVQFIQGLLNPLWNNNKREESVLYAEAHSRGCFYNRKTDEMREWDELSQDEYLEGDWYNSNPYMRQYKEQGREMPDVKPNTGKKLSDTVAPGQVYYKDVGMVNWVEEVAGLAKAGKLDWVKKVAKPKFPAPLPPMPKPVAIFDDFDELLEANKPNNNF